MRERRCLKTLQFRPIIHQSDNVAQEQLFQLYVFIAALERTARGEVLISRTRGGAEKSFVFESVVRKPIQVWAKADRPPRTLI